MEHNQDIELFIESIINSLSDDLLKSEHKKQKNRNKYSGHCYVATETLYYLLDYDIQKDFSPAILKVKNITHWFLKNKITGEIIDITKKQFDFKLDYSNSRFCGFLTKEPSKRTKILINRIYEKFNI